MADRKLAAMHKEYGKAHGYKCGDCPHLTHNGGTPCTRHYKCRAYGLSASAATDWARGWEACFLYNVPLPADHVPLFERMQRSRVDDNKPIKGQIDMFGGTVGEG